MKQKLIWLSLSLNLRSISKNFLQVVYDEDGCYSRPDYFGEGDKYLHKISCLQNNFHKIDYFLPFHQ